MRVLLQDLLLRPDALTADSYTVLVAFLRKPAADELQSKALTVFAQFLRVHQTEAYSRLRRIGAPATDNSAGSIAPVNSTQIIEFYLHGGELFKLAAILGGCIQGSRIECPNNRGIWFNGLRISRRPPLNLCGHPCVPKDLFDAAVHIEGSGPEKDLVQICEGSHMEGIRASDHGEIQLIIRPCSVQAATRGSAS